MLYYSYLHYYYYLFMAQSLGRTDSLSLDQYLFPFLHPQQSLFILFPGVSISHKYERLSVAFRVIYLA